MGTPATPQGTPQERKIDVSLAFRPCRDVSHDPLGLRNCHWYLRINNKTPENFSSFKNSFPPNSILSRYSTALKILSRSIQKQKLIQSWTGNWNTRRLSISLQYFLLIGEAYFYHKRYFSIGRQTCSLLLRNSRLNLGSVCFADNQQTCANWTRENSQSNVEILCEIFTDKYYEKKMEDGSAFLRHLHLSEKTYEAENIPCHLFLLQRQLRLPHLLSGKELPIRCDCQKPNDDKGRTAEWTCERWVASMFLLNVRPPASHRAMAPTACSSKLKITTAQMEIYLGLSRRLLVKILHCLSCNFSRGNYTPCGKTWRFKSHHGRFIRFPHDRHLHEIGQKKTFTQKRWNCPEMKLVSFGYSQHNSHQCYFHQVNWLATLREMENKHVCQLSQVFDRHCKTTATSCHYLRKSPTKQTLSLSIIKMKATAMML